MLRFLKRLFSGRNARDVRTYREAAAALPGGTPGAARATRPSGPRRLEEDEPVRDGEAASEDFEGLGGVDNLDRERRLERPLAKREEGLLSRVRLWVEAERYDLPILPATNMAAMDMAANPSADLAEIVSLIATDPVLSSELLKIANSVLYATHAPASTLHEAVMRIGTRGLRSLIYSVSVKGLVLRTRSLETYSNEVWRQAYSVGSIARAISPQVSFDPERAFLIGLLHDLGKVVLLSMLSKASEKSSDITPTIVGRVFYDYHELVGAKVCRNWKLDDELVSVAGCHHDFERNTDHPRSAALASLAHRLDLVLSSGDAEEYRHLKHLPHFAALGVPEPRREEILRRARETYLELRRQGDGLAPAAAA